MLAARFLNFFIFKILYLMKPIDFEGSNIIFNKPSNMTDEQCGSLHGYKGQDIAGVPFILVALEPSEKDIENIFAGRPVMVKFVGTTIPPIAAFTYDDKGKMSI